MRRRFENSLTRKEHQVNSVVEYYLQLGEKNATNPKGKAYISKAAEICEKFNVGKPFYLNREYCPLCHNVLVPSVTSQVRINHGRVVTTCKICGYKISRSFPKRRKVQVKDSKTGQ